MSSAETVAIEPQNVRAFLHNLISSTVKVFFDHYITDVAEALSARDFIAGELKKHINKWEIPYEQDIDPNAYSKIEAFIKKGLTQEITMTVRLEEELRIRQEVNEEIDFRNAMILRNPSYINIFNKRGIKFDLLRLAEGWGSNTSESSTVDQDNDITADVFIGIPQEHLNLFDIEAIQNATGDLMESFGYEMESKDEPVYGSFFQRLRYLFRGEVVEAEAGDLYTKGKKALEAQLLNKPTAEVTEKQADAVAKLIVALAPIDEAVLRLGTLMIVKIQRNGIPVIAVETLSPELAAMMDANPRFLENPRLVFEMLATTKSPTNQLEPGASESIEL